MYVTSSFFIFFFWYTVQHSTGTRRPGMYMVAHVVCSWWSCYSCLVARCALVASLNWLLTVIFTIESGRLFQSLMVLAKMNVCNRLFAVIVVKVLELVCREDRVAGYMRLPKGMDRWPWTALWKMTSLLICLLSASDSYSSFLIILVTHPGDIDLKSFRQNLAALRCTDSNLLIKLLVWSSQTLDEYSTSGGTKVLYADTLISCGHWWRFLMTNPRVLLTLVDVWLMWSFQERSLVKVIPRWSDFLSCKIVSPNL